MNWKDIYNNFTKLSDELAKELKISTNCAAQILLLRTQLEQLEEKLVQADKQGQKVDISKYLH